MFNFEDELRCNSIPAARQAARHTLEERQRDVYESHRHRTFSLAFYMTGNEVEAEEILTNTFIRAFEQNDQPDGAGVDVALIEELSFRFPSMREMTPAPFRTGAANHGLEGQSVLRPDLEVAIQRLPELERILFLLRDVEGYSLETIERLLGVARADAAVALLSARLRLRHILASEPTRTSEAA